MPDTDPPAPVPTVASLKQWGVGKETRGMVVSFTLADPMEARAWQAWLLNREVERDQALAPDGFRFLASLAPARAAPAPQQPVSPPWLPPRARARGARTSPARG